MPGPSFASQRWRSNDGSPRRCEGRADLPSELYAYRPGRNAQQAVVAVEELLFRGHSEVVDADLADYFGSIPHAELLKSVARRIVDRRVLHLIKMWLDCRVEETDDRGRRTRTTEARDKRRGIPQGSPISPLLANLYMRRFVLGWKMFGLERAPRHCLITYADDLVILCSGQMLSHAPQIGRWRRRAANAQSIKRPSTFFVRAAVAAFSAALSPSPPRAPNRRRAGRGRRIRRSFHRWVTPAGA